MLDKPHTHWLILIVLVLGTLCSLPLPAPPLDPPSRALQSARNQVVSGVFFDQLADGRYRFREVEGIRGPDEAPAELLVRGPQWLAAWLLPGERYLFAYTAYIRNPRFRKEVLVDTDGPRLLDGPGLEPALFAESDGLRATLLHPLDEAFLGSQAFLDALAAGLSSKDTQLQNFHAAEFALIGELRRSAQPGVVRAVKAVIGERDGHPAARATLLRVAAANEAVYSRAWLADAVARLLTQAPLLGYQQLQSGQGELIAEALRLEQAHALGVDIGLLERLVGCDSAAISEAALLAIRKRDPARENKALQEALKLTQLPATTREFLRDHLRRLDLAAGRTPGSVPPS